MQQTSPYCRVLPPGEFNPSIIPEPLFYSESLTTTVVIVSVSHGYKVIQVVLLSQRGRAMIRVIEYFAQSLKFIRNDTVE